MSSHTACRRIPCRGVSALLADVSIPLLLNALDVACVLGADSKFSRHSYPAKLCEAMACGTAVVASATAPVRWMLGDDSHWLVPLADPHALADRIIHNLGLGKVTYPTQPDWPDVARKFSGLIQQPRSGQS